MQNSRVMLGGAFSVGLIFLTFLTGHLFVPENKTIVFWLCLLILGVAELSWVLSISMSPGRSGGLIPDQAVRSIAWACVGGYLVVGIGVLGLRAIIGKSGFPDGALGGVLLGLAVFVVLAIFLVSVRGIRQAELEAPRIERRTEEVNLSKELIQVLEFVNNLKLEVHECRQVRHSIEKQLEISVRSMSHFQGQHAEIAEANSKIQQIVQNAGYLRETTPADPLDQLQKLQLSIRSLNAHFELNSHL